MGLGSPSPFSATVPYIYILKQSIENGFRYWDILVVNLNLFILRPWINGPKKNIYTFLILELSLIVLMNVGAVFNMLLIMDAIDCDHPSIISCRPLVVFKQGFRSRQHW